MGTRGLYTFKYKGKYYIFYNHWDSYPEGGLGDKIVEELKGVDLDEMRRLVEMISEDDVIREDDFTLRKNYEGLMEALRNVTEYRLEDISEYEPTFDFDAEYIYIIDLDKNVFKVIYSNERDTESQRYKLTDIPEDWKDLLI